MRKLICVLLLAGCGGGLERVSFVTDQLTYEPGGRVMLSMGNVSASEVKVNLCLARLVDEQGESVGVSNVETCEFENETIPAGEQRSVRKTMPSSVSGKLRYEATIVLPNGRGETVLSPVFTVQK
ncbi:MAG: hypothetical protein ACO1OB_34155 [Archangium sp.]